MTIKIIKSQFLELLEMDKEGMKIYREIFENVTDTRVKTVIQEIMDNREKNKNLVEQALSVLSSL